MANPSPGFVFFFSNFVTLILFLISQSLAKLVEILLESKKKKPKKKNLANSFGSKRDKFC
jgi:hypothetical protein